MKKVLSVIAFLLTATNALAIDKQLLKGGLDVVELARLHCNESADDLDDVAAGFVLLLRDEGEDVGKLLDQATAKAKSTKVQENNPLLGKLCVSVHDMVVGNQSVMDSFKFDQEMTTAFQAMRVLVKLNTLKHSMVK